MVLGCSKTVAHIAMYASNPATVMRHATDMLGAHNTRYFTSQSKSLAIEQGLRPRAAARRRCRRAGECGTRRLGPIPPAVDLLASWLRAEPLNANRALEELP